MQKYVSQPNHQEAYAKICVLFPEGVHLSEYDTYHCSYLELGLKIKYVHAWEQDTSYA